MRTIQEHERGLAELRRLLASRYAQPAGEIELKAGGLRGGLMADLLRVSAARPGGAPEHFVVKRTREADARERAAYAALASCGLSHLAPRLLGTSADPGGDYLFLEYVSRWKAWPWKEHERAGMVLDLLAELHAARIEEAASLQQGYEEGLQAAALYTLDLLRTAGGGLREPRLLRGVRHVRAFAFRLPDARRLLLASPVFLHGDVHPGNVLARSGGQHRLVLLDWGRARMGSRFEDVASWLQCLRYFEPSAAAAHDRLLLRYIRAAGLGERITAAHRREYWVAAGCNALAGALGVHLRTALEARTPAARGKALAAAADWVRIVRRALAYLDGRAAGTTPPRDACGTN